MPAGFTTPPTPESATASPQRLDEVLAWNLVRSARFVGHRMTARLSGLGINPIQFGVLAFLADSDELTTAEVARAVLIRPQSMAPLLDGLEDRGLIHRTGQRTRGRRNPVRITDAGRAVLDAAWTVAVDGNDLGDTGLTHEESRRLNQLLRKLAAATATTAEDDP